MRTTPIGSPYNAPPPANPPKLTPRRWTRRALLKRALAGGGLVGGGATLAYAAGWAPFRPVLERVEIPLPNLPAAFDNFRIAFLSDFHVQPGFSADDLRPAIALANRARPDLILLAGDCINRHVDRLRPAGGWPDDRDAYLRDDFDPDAFPCAPNEHLTQCAAALSRLRAAHGVFTAFGNHDFPPPPGDPPRALWRDAGITPLLNEVVPLRRGRDALWIVGLRSLLLRQVWPAEVIARAPASAVRIVVWHEPDRAAEVAAAGASLQLSGHTHGGQVVVPGIGPLVLPPMGRKYPSGAYRVGAMPLYVTRGVGLLAPRVRFCCPPEVTLLTLRKSSK